MKAPFADEADRMSEFSLAHVGKKALSVSAPRGLNILLELLVFLWYALHKVCE